MNINNWDVNSELILLHGDFPSNVGGKNKYKKILDDLGFRWTIKLGNNNVTKVIAHHDWEYEFRWKLNATNKFIQFCINLGRENVVNPKEFQSMLNTRDFTDDMSENSQQIIDLLKTMDYTNVKLAISLISNSFIESKWIPWLLINKDVTGVKELLKLHNISPGKFHVENTKWNFKNAVRDLFTRLRVEDNYKKEFLLDFYNKIK